MTGVIEGRGRVFGNAETPGQRAWSVAYAPKRVSMIPGLGNRIKASTMDHAQTDHRTLADSIGLMAQEPDRDGGFGGPNKVGFELQLSDFSPTAVS
jgi:hypothetical protein